MLLVKNSNSVLLKQNGCHAHFLRHWARYLLSRMGFVKRQFNTKSEVGVATFESEGSVSCRGDKIILISNPTLPV